MSNEQIAEVILVMIAAPLVAISVTALIVAVVEAILGTDDDIHE